MSELVTNPAPSTPPSATGFDGAESANHASEVSRRSAEFDERGAKVASLIGYHGFQNAGDDAFCTILTSWASQLLGIERLEISGAPKHLPRVSVIDEVGAVGVEPEDRGGRIAKFLREPTYLIRKDAVIFGAGSIFAVRRFWWLAVQLWVLRLFRKLRLTNTVVAGIGISIGPFKRPTDRFWCRHVLRQFDVITVRDQESWEIGGSFGLRTLIPSCDLALAMPKFFHIPKHDLSRDATVAPVIGFSVVDRDAWFGTPEVDDRKRKAMVESMIALARRYPKACFRGIVFCGHPTQGDHVATQKILDELNAAGCNTELVDYENDPQLLLDELSEVDVMLCNRMHSFVFSCLTQTPAVMISYASKMVEYAEMLEVPMDLRFSHNELDATALGRSLESLLEQPRLAYTPHALERCSAELVVDLELAAAMIQQVSHSLRRRAARAQKRPAVERRRLADFPAATA